MIERSADAFAVEEDALIGAAYQSQMKDAEKAYDMLRLEHDQLLAQLSNNR